ncbi:MAG: ribonucleoside-diphosphate reductase subunit alpha [Bdellovibrionota bacterium]|nr:MAG: ribonucleoside-diphosphate reductase subunit alpha [Bdellovibrionota bacterium]
MTVVKRNGMLVPFRRDRIATAVEAAFRAVKGISITEPLPHDIYTTVQSVTDEVVKEARARARQGSSLTVEGIQDLVEEKLMHTGHYDVARSYIIYRDEHKALRDDSPRNLKVFRRDGKTLVRFNPMKIASAIEKAFRAAHRVEGPTPQNLIDAVNLVANKVVNRAVQLAKEGQNLHVELIQDEVERQMMAEGFFREAKDFIIYRAKRAELRAREEAAAILAPSDEVQIERRQLVLETVGREFQAQDAHGGPVIVREAELRRRIEFACRDHRELVSADIILEESIKNFYEGIKISEVDTCNIFAARSRIEKEPAYSYVTARLLLDVIYRETLGLEAHDPALTKRHREYFHEYLKKAISVERLAPELLQFDLEKIANAIDLSRDLNFTYLGLQTLYDRYLIHHEDTRLETPQIFWMRVAMGLAVNEGALKNEKAIEFYNVLSRFLFTSSTPTLFNAGTLHPQLSSCYLTTVKDDLKHIFKCVQDDAMLSKWAGGLGNDWTSVRATGARIKGTNGRSQGVIPFLKVANDTAVAVNQGGKRKGAMCAYLETWHLDIEDFLELRKNTGDERRRTHDMNTANWIPDLFMKRVAERGMWTLFSPSDVPDLHDLYGQAFEKRYLAYEQMVERGEIKLFKKIEALTLWRKMLSMLFETGHPWITFKDPSNIRSPQDHVGVVHSSNLCTEILLNTSENETAVCNLGSVNLATHCTANGLDRTLLETTIRTAVRMLDNVIDINFYPTAEAKNANLKHRPVGLGIMGFQDALYIQGFSYASPEAVRFADQSMEAISYFAILASTELAAERGAYPSYEGSKWQRGMLPIDTLALLVNERGEQHVEVDISASLDWSPVRSAIKKHGMRNSNVMAIAPTATISNITGVSQSIEPEYKHLFVKSNLSGEFIVHNTYLVEELKKHGIWDEQMVDDLKYFDGSIAEIERIPEEVRRKFLTAFEIEPEWLIECASRRQKWIDMGQSLNLYISEPNGKKLHDMYMLAWRKALKTTYYLRSLAATQIEKSTTDINKRGLQPRWMKSKSASADVQVDREVAPAQPAVEAKTAAMPKAVCNLDGDCESCQ